MSCDNTVGLAKEEQTSSDFGPVRVGQKAIVTVPIVNRSKKTASVSLVNGMKKFEKFGVTAQPTEFHLKPKETMNIIFSFEPKFRVPVFTEEVQMEVEGTAQTLLFLSGSGQVRFFLCKWAERFPGYRAQVGVGDHVFPSCCSKWNEYSENEIEKYRRCSNEVQMG